MNVDTADQDLDDFGDVVDAASANLAAGYNHYDPGAMDDFVFQKTEGARVFANIILRPQSSIATLLDKLLKCVIPSTGQTQTRLVVQTIRFTQEECQKLYANQSAGISTTFHPPMNSPQPSYSKRQREIIAPGANGALRLTFPRGTESIYRVSMDAMIPCVFGELAQGGSKAASLNTPPIGLGPAVEVDAVQFVSYLSEAMEEMTKNEGNECFLVMGLSAITISFAYEKVFFHNTNTALMHGSMDGSIEDPISTSVSGKTTQTRSWVVPYGGHADTPAANQQNMRSVTFDAPISRAGGMCIDVEQSDLGEWISRLSVRRGGAGVSTTTSDRSAQDLFAKMEVDFTFVPPVAWRAQLGWRPSQWLGTRDDDLPDICGFFMHTAMQVASDATVLTSGQTCSFFDGNTSMASGFPTAAYAHFLDVHQLSRPEESPMSADWAAWASQNLPADFKSIGLDPVATHEKDAVSEFKFRQNAMSRLFSACQSERTRTKMWLPRGDGDDARETLSLLVEFEDLQETPQANNSAGNADSSRGSAGRGASTLAKYVSKHASSNCAMDLMLYTWKTPTNGYMADVDGERVTGNPLYRSKMAAASSETSMSDLDAIDMSIMWCPTADRFTSREEAIREALNDAM